METEQKINKGKGANKRMEGINEKQNMPKWVEKYIDNRWKGQVGQ